MTSVTANPKANRSSKRIAKLALAATFAFLFSACSSVPNTPELETAGAVKYLKQRVASDLDDVEQRATGEVMFTSTDLELTYDASRGPQVVGVRFHSLAIPQGAKIQRAEVRFKADENDTGSATLVLHGDDSDSAARFEKVKYNLSKRTKTAAKVTWQPRGWKTGEQGGKQVTPSIAPILQEVVNRSGWRSGNAFALLISGNSKAKRVAESYRGDRNGAPMLYVEYTVSTTSAGPSAPAPAPTPVTTQPKGVLYVSPKGSDSNTGRAKGEPLKTIYRASQLVQPGDTVYLRGGVYKGRYQSYFGYDRKPFMTDGRKDAPITIMSYPGEKAIIDGGDRHYSDYASVSSPALFKVKANYYVVQNLTFRNGAGRALVIKGDHNVVRNVLSYNNHSDGIYGMGDHNLFEDFVSHGNNSKQNGGDSADGLKLSFGSHNTVRNCHTYNNSDDGIDIWATLNSLVEHCVAHHNGYGYSGNGIGFKMGGNHVKDNNAMVRYNVGFKNRINFDNNGSGGVTMVHNTSWRARQIGIIGYAPASTGKAPVVLKNNLSYQDPKPKGTEKATIQRNNSWNLGISNPNFVSLEHTSSGFLKLKSSSPAVDAGVKLSLTYQGAAPDLGALELGRSLAQLLGSEVRALQGGELRLAGN